MEKKKGAPLGDDERVRVERTFEEENTDRIAALAKTHLAALTKTPKVLEAAVKTAVDERRAAVMQLRDPFTPVIAGDTTARAREIVLWESASVLIVVDLYSPRPKALVMPKAPLLFPSDADDGTLQELALMAAYVSDAFSELTGCAAAAMWVNPPQQLMAKLLHVHVLPRLPPFSPGNEPFFKIQDPQLRQDAADTFALWRLSLEKKLGPST